MRKLLFYCFAVIFLLVQCNSESDQRKKEQTFSHYFEKSGEITFQNVIFGSIEIKPFREGYLIMDNDRGSLEWFSSEGELVKKIISRGKGPNEFVKIGSFVVDKKNNIYAYDVRLRRFSIFDSSGQFIKSFQLKESFRTHEMAFANGYIYSFSGFTHPGLPTFITVIDPKKEEIVNRFFRPNQVMEELGIPIAGTLRNMDISDKRIIITHPLQLKTYFFNLNGKLIKSFEGSSTIYEPPDLDYKIPAPLHTALSALILANFTYNGVVVIGLKELSKNKDDDFYIELYTFEGSKINEYPIYTGSRYLLLVDSKGRFYFKKPLENAEDLSTTIEIYRLENLNN